MKESLSVVTKSIREDPELYYAYQANIAMAFKDLYWGMPHETREDIHEIANEGAKHFLNIWIRE